MSTTAIHLHRVVSIALRSGNVEDNHWLDFNLLDAQGSLVLLTAYIDKGVDAKALLAQMFADSVETIQLDAYAEGRADQCEARAMGEAA